MSLSDFLFDTPWWVLTLLVAGGAYIWYIGNTRTDKTIKLAGIAAIAGGVLLLILSLSVSTAKEQVTKQTRQIVQAFVDRDWTKLQAMLPQRVSLAEIYSNRDQLIAGGKKTVDTIGLKSGTITGLEVAQNDTVITVDLTVLTTQDATLDRPTPTNWRFDWENLGNGWILDRIEPLQGRDVSKADLISHMSK